MESCFPELYDFLQKVSNIKAQNCVMSFFGKSVV